MFTIAEVIKLLTRIFVKQNKRFPKGLEGVDIRIKAKEIHDVGKANDYKGGISENQLKHFLAFEKQAPVTREVSQDIIKVPKKKGEVVDLTGKKIDTSKPILGGKNVPESGEIIAKESPLIRDNSLRIKQGLSTKIKLNSLRENEQFAKDLIGRKNTEFNSLDRTSQKEILDRLNINIKNTKADFATPVDPEDLASGGRVPMIFGGSAGLKALWMKLMRASGPEVKSLFPRVKKGREELGKLVNPQAMESMESLNLQQLENLLEALKIDKRSIAVAAESKAMKDPGLDFVMGKMKEDKSWGFDIDRLAKYTDIDNDIMIVEQMVKNKTMKGRKPNAYGGIAGMLGERTGYDNGKLVEGEEEIFYPPYETNDPEEAIKEIINRLINVDPTKIPLTDKMELMFDLNRIKAGGSIDLFGGELGFGYNKDFDRDDEGYGFEWTKKFNKGGLAPMLGEPTYEDGGRVPLGGGKLAFDAARRKFLQMIGAGAAGVGAAKSGLFGLLKASKPAAQVLTQVPIGNAAGMPVWFKPLVNKVIKQGDDVSKTAATGERQIVHRAEIDKDTSVDVIQDLETGNVRIEYDAADNLGYGPIQLDYKAGEIIEQGSKKGTKTKPEFSAVESEPRVTNWDGDIEFDGENIVNKVDDLLTDTTKLETYATGKNPNIKKLLKSEQKKKYVNKLNDDQMEQLEYIENKHGPGPDPTDFFDEKDLGKDFASGGRVPLAEGGDPGTSSAEEVREAWKDYLKEKEKGTFKGSWKQYQPIWIRANLAQGGRVPLGKGKIVKGLAKLMDEFFPGTTKIGKTSKPMAEKTQLKQAIAGFQEREAAKLKASKDRLATAEELDDASEIVDPSGEAYIVYEGMTVGQLDDLVAKEVAYADDMHRQYMRGNLDKYVKPEVLEEQKLFRQKKIDKVLNKAYDEVFYQKPVSGDYKYDADVLADSIAEELGKVYDDLPQTHQTQIYNTALKRVQQDLKMKRTLKEVGEKMQLSDFDIKGRKKNATGGRVPLFAGGPAWKAWKAFIEKLFLKTSNEIRQGKGIWQGLNQEQWIKQHDNLTKKLKEWEMGGKKALPPGMKEYFGMNDIQLANAFKKAKAKEFPTLKKMTLSPEEELRRDIKKGVADVMEDTSEAGLARSIEVDNLKLEFPGISDDMINNILTDTNPQRIAEVKQTMREALKMQGKGMGPDQIIDIFKTMKDRKLNATGGRVSLSAGGLAGMLGE
jgi:hypothetical protein